MRVTTRISSFVLAALIPLACTTTDPARINPAKGSISGAAYPEKIDEYGMPIPMGPDQRGASNRGRGPASAGEILLADGPYVVNLADVPAHHRPDGVTTMTGPANKRSHAPGPISEERMAELRARAKTLPPNARAGQTQETTVGDVFAGAPASVDGFFALDVFDCCGGVYATVPPDPELAAGNNHVVVAVNSAFAVFDKLGNKIGATITFEDFFNDARCDSTFDPNVLYDPSADRYFLGIVGNAAGSHYCMAVSQTADPTSSWNQFILPVAVGGNFFDFPHAGVGADAIYIGANMFGSSYVESVVFAVEKDAMYDNNAGTSPEFVFASVNDNFTPQPMHIRGDAFPAANSGNTHYFVTNASSYTADDFVIWKWSDPFNSGISPVGSFSLASDSPMVAGYPSDQPQLGNRRAAILDGGDWRPQDAEFFSGDGSLLMTHTVSCNPGGGTVNCVRWAKLDPATASVIEVDMLNSSGEFRSYGDGAVNRCGDAAFGYTKTSSSMYPGIWAADATGLEFELKPGETTYQSFQSWRQANRWGDYTAMTVDPDGETFWYVGEYAASNGYSTNWSTWVSSFKLPSCDSGGGGGNLTPAAADDAFSLDVQDGNNPSLSENVLGNDSLGNTPTSASVFAAPTNGTLSLSGNGDFTYTPTLGFTGTDSFVYAITDNDLESDTANVVIQVSDSGPANLIPSAADDSFSMDVATVASITESVLSNDDQGDAPATVTAWGNPSNGSLSGTTPAGGFTYTPTSGFTGDDSFGYTIRDANGDTSSATVTVTVSDSGAVTEIHIEALDGAGSIADSRGRWDATVTVTLSQALSGASVTGSWSGGAKGGGSCTTGTDGSCAITKNRIRDNSATFTVDNVSAAGYSYDPSSNVVSSIDVGPQ